MFCEYFHNSYTHDPDLCMVLFHPLTLFVLKVSSSMVFHSYLLGMLKTSSLAHTPFCAKALNENITVRFPTGTEIGKLL